MELYYAAGALKITPKTDATGLCFEAQFFEANKFEATTPTGRFIQRPVATPQGAKLDIEPEAGT